MRPKLRTFKTSDGIADIPEADVTDFLKDYPDAKEVQSFLVDKDTADVELEQVNEFLQDFPEAKPLHETPASPKLPEVAVLSPEDRTAITEKLSHVPEKHLTDPNFVDVFVKKYASARGVDQQAVRDLFEPQKLQAQVLSLQDKYNTTKDPNALYQLAQLHRRLGEDDKALEAVGVADKLTRDALPQVGDGSPVQPGNEMTFNGDNPDQMVAVGSDTEASSNLKGIADAMENYNYFLSIPKMIGAGVEKVSRGADKLDQFKTMTDVADGVFDVSVGVGEAVLGAMGGTPEGGVFFAGFDQVSKSLPENAAQWLSPVSKLITEHYKEKGEEVPHWAENTAAIADFALLGAAMHGAGKVAGEIKNIKNTSRAIRFNQWSKQLTPKMVESALKQVEKNQIEFADKPEQYQAALFDRANQVMETGKAVKAETKAEISAVEPYEPVANPGTLRKIPEGADVEMGGKIGKIERGDDGTWYFNSEDKSTQIKVEDKFNPTETLDELGIEVLPDITPEAIARAAADAEQVGTVQVGGKEYFVSLGNKNNPADITGDIVAERTADGGLKPRFEKRDAKSESFMKDRKLKIINAFLESKGLPKRKSLHEPWTELKAEKAGEISPKIEEKPIEVAEKAGEIPTKPETPQSKPENTTEDESTIYADIKVPEKKGTWRDTFNAADWATKGQIADVISDMQSATPQELIDIYNAAKQMEGTHKSRALWNLANNKSTPDIIFDEIIKSKELEKVASDFAVQKIIEKRKTAEQPAEVLPEKVEPAISDAIDKVQLVRLVQDGTALDVLQRGEMDPLDFMELIDKHELPLPDWFQKLEDTASEEMGYRTPEQDARLLELINRAVERTGLEEVPAEITVYRGLRSGVNEEGGYKAGKFVTLDKDNAARYHKNVGEFTIPDNLKTLKYDSKEADTLTREFLEGLGENKGGIEKGGKIDFDDKMSLFTGEAEEVWVEFLKSKGYEATSIENNSLGRAATEIHIFDPQVIKAVEPGIKNDVTPQPLVEAKPEPVVDKAVSENIAPPVEETPAVESSRSSLIDKLDRYAMAGKRARKEPAMQKLFDQIRKEASALGFTLGYDKQGKLQAINKKGKMIRRSPVKRTQEQKQLDQEAEVRRKRVLASTPHTVEQWIMQHLLAGGKIAEADIIRLMGKDYKDNVMSGIADKSGANTLHDLWESAKDEEIGGGKDWVEDNYYFDEAVANVLGEVGSKESMVDKLLDAFGRNDQDRVAREMGFKDAAEMEAAIPEEYRKQALEETEQEVELLSDEEVQEWLADLDAAAPKTTEEINQFYDDHGIITDKLNEKNTNAPAEPPAIERAAVSAETESVLGKPEPPEQWTREKEERLTTAKQEVADAKQSLRNKRAELNKNLLKDAEDLFGERKSAQDNAMFDERADAAQMEPALKPYKDRVALAEEKVKEIEAEQYVPEASGNLFAEIGEMNQGGSAGMAKKKKAPSHPRIKPEPITGKATKKISDIIMDAGKALKARIIFARSGRRNSLGSYHPSAAGTRIRYNGDLDTTAHEIGHMLDDRHSFFPEMQKQSAWNAMEKELDTFAEYGSSPRKNMSPAAQRAYTLMEGVAEWMRAWLVNPDATKAQAPEVTAFFESHIPKEVQKQLRNFGDDIRVWEGATAMDKIMANVADTPPKKQNLLSYLLNGRKASPTSEFKVTVWDDLARKFWNPLKLVDKAFKQAIELGGGKVQDVASRNDPRMLARLILGGDRKSAEFLKEGFRDSQNRVVIDAKTGRPMNLDWLMDAFDTTNEKTITESKNKTVAYMIAKRTLELSTKLDKADRITGIGAGEMMDTKVAQDAIKEFDALPLHEQEMIIEAARRYREIADQTLRYMVEKGRMHYESYQLIKDNNLEYVALNRITESEPGGDVNIAFRKPSGKLGIKAEPVRKIKGSTKTIIDPFVSLLDNMHRIIKESDRNDFMRAFTEPLLEQRGMHDGPVIRYSDIGEIVPAGTKDAITVYIDGNPYSIRFAKDIQQTLTGFDQTINHPLLNMLGAPASVLRWSVTHFPVFAARNWFRDVQSRIIVSSTGLKDLFGSKTDKNDLAAIGGLNSGHYMRDHEHYYKGMQEAIHRVAQDKRNIVVDANKFKKYWEKYTDLLESAERANRVAEYRGKFREAKEKGMDDYDAQIYAAYHSRDLLDFAFQGEYMKVINRVIPFSNAMVQGLRRAALGAKENPAAFAVRLGLVVGMPHVIEWYLNHQDEEKAKIYENQPDYQRDLFYNIPMGDYNLVFPKPYELSLFGAGISRALSAENGNKKAFDGFAGTVAHTMFPFNETNFLGPLQTGAEIAFNKDLFRGKAIVPVNEENLNMELRRTENSSRIGKAAMKAFGVDPRYVDFFIKDQFSYFGNFGLKVTELGREDSRHEFNISDTGFAKEMPGANAKAFENLQDYAKKNGLTQSKDFRQVAGLTYSYYNAPTAAGKKLISLQVIDESKALLQKWENTEQELNTFFDLKVAATRYDLKDEKPYKNLSKMVADYRRSENPAEKDVLKKMIVSDSKILHDFWYSKEFKGPYSEDEYRKRGILKEAGVEAPETPEAPLAPEATQ